jgi:hypothetical protein
MENQTSYEWKHPDILVVDVVYLLLYEAKAIDNSIGIEECVCSECGHTFNVEGEVYYKQPVRITNIRPINL